MPTFDLSYTALQSAICENQEEIALMLIEHGVDCVYGSSLSTACRNAASVKLVSAIVNQSRKTFRGAPDDFSHKVLAPALFMAIRAESLELVKFLLDAGADATATKVFYDHEAPAIHEACTIPTVSAEILQALIDSVEDEETKVFFVNEQNIYRGGSANSVATPMATPLVCCCFPRPSEHREKAREKVLVLLKSGANVNRESPRINPFPRPDFSPEDPRRKNNLTPLEIAICSPRQVDPKLVELLLDHGARVTTSTLAFAEQSCEASIIERMKQPLIK
jgi:ankyrin repeat protein